MLIALSLDGSVARVADRERWVAAAGAARARPAAPFTGLFHVATCYRIELYGWLDHPSTDPIADAVALAEPWYGAAAAEFHAAATARFGAAAVGHLLRMASGLESPSAGDQYLLAQVRRAHTEAAAAGTLGSTLDRLLQTALRTGRRIRRESAFGAGAGSLVSLAAAAIVEHRGPSFGRCVVVGAGAMAGDAARVLGSGRPADLVIVNRGRDRAERVAVPLGARTAPLARLADEVRSADVIVVATGSAVALVTPDMVPPRRDGTEALIIDLALPRNVDPRVGGIPGVRLLDLDDLARRPVEGGCLEVDRTAAEDIVAEEAARFERWIAEGTGRVALEPLREALEEACRREVGFISTTHLAERVARRVVARVCAGPMKLLRSQLASRAIG